VADEDCVGAFLSGLRGGRFALQVCSACGRWRWPPRLGCPACMDTAYAWNEASGLGRIWTFTTVRRTAPALQEETPFVVAVVALDEAPAHSRIMARLRNCRPQEAGIEMPVSLKIDTGTADLFWFEPARI
jgi:uncharacterized protein